MNTIRWIEAVPGRRPLRLVGGNTQRWVEWRPKLGVWDVLEPQQNHWRQIPRLVCRTECLLDAAARMLRGR